MKALLVVIALALGHPPVKKPVGVVWAQRHGFTCWIEMDRDARTGRGYFNWYCSRNRS